MRDVAVVAFAQVPNEAATMKTPVEMIVPTWLRTEGRW